MHIVAGVPSMPDVPGAVFVGLAQAVDEAKEKATRILRDGFNVRMIHEQGCGNTSQQSTADGSLRAADEIITNMLGVEPEEDRLFGNNIRQAARALRTLFGRA